MSIKLPCLMDELVTFASVLKRVTFASRQHTNQTLAAAMRAKTCRRFSDKKHKKTVGKDDER
ncbi:hypothetical protein QWZ16_17445 [Vibrio ostreicida]|uniref:Uncharacterized protein n=1 Tax=Vibrio ostreicida TaxID=526588 RepID=A0ABT8BYD3_9VIBR|nr:hypothetical protein [Vibrio ostreicida]MDN3611389.1 hypothetical protein [Vibrio ostreicida]